MAHIPQRLSRGFILAIAGILCITMLAPAAALADTNLTIGGSAQIAYANGDDVRLRESAGYDGTVLALIPEGTVLNVLDGPFNADDGSTWYQVSYNDQAGYMVSDYLAVFDANADPQQTADAEAAVTAAAPAAPVGMAIIAGTNGDGVRCHTDANANSATITVLPEGTVVDLTGDLIDVWQPVNCGGSSGYVHSAYVSYDGSDPAGDAGVQQDQQDQSADASSATTFAASSVVTGTAVVTGTNGDGVRCRTGAGYDSSTIMVLSEGTTVNLRGDPQGEWQPVICADTDGFAHIDYLAIGGSSDSGSSGVGADTSAAEADSATGSATVTGTDGGGLNCRSGATFGNNVITILPEGATVSLRGVAQGDWQPVICGGSNGFVSIDYLSSGGGSGSASGGGGDTTATGQGVVTDAGGGLRCRTAPSLDSSVITVFPNGATIDLRGDASDGWIPVVCAGQAGFSSADYISYGDYVAPGDSGSGGSSSDGGSSSGGGSNSSLTSGSLAEVAGTNGDGLRLRSGPSYDSSTVTVMPEGAIVDVIDGSTGDWVAVSYNGSNGYSHMDYLVASDGSSSSSGGGSSSSGGSSAGSANESSGSGDGYRLASGDHAEVTDYLNLRYEPSSSAGIAAVAPPGTVVEITGIPTAGYYPVSWDGLEGYMYTSWLSSTDAATTSRGGSAPSSSDDGGSTSGSSGGSSGGGSGSASGQAMVDFAMQYLGYPYVWATAGPGSFDCSGFTYWVALNVLGIDIGRGTDSQPNYGTPVSRDNLQPGDLVFFQNTYTWGLSHVGIYIGNGQFIHAENESTGVRISDLDSPYYSSRWYGATRLA